jgi:hypothetical protein
MKRSKRIPLLSTDQEAAVYWDTHSLAERIEDTGESTIRFVRRPKRALSIHLDPEDIVKVEAIAEATPHTPTPPFQKVLKNAVCDSIVNMARVVDRDDGWGGEPDGSRYRKDVDDTLHEVGDCRRIAGVLGFVRWTMKTERHAWATAS